MTTFKITPQNNGILTDNNTQNTARFLDLKDIVPNFNDASKKYTPSEGYFLNNQDTLTCPINAHPNYIDSSSNCTAGSSKYFGTNVAKKIIDTELQKTS